jgi:hypothetical protein
VAIANETGARNGEARKRERKDFEWITNYGRGLQEELRRLYDQAP